MKKTLSKDAKFCVSTLLAAVLITATVWAQTPQSFKYQAVARDASGEVIANQQVSFQISILQGSESGTSVYSETHSDSTNQFGLVTLEIGTGTTTDDFTAIDWSSDTYFIKVEMDATGGTSYTLMGTSQLLSVPYALYAKTAETFTGTITETDPLFTAWDKSTGISITESQISDLNHFTTSDETDQIFTASVAENITASDTTRWGSTAGEVDPLFTAWDKSTGIVITESQISDLQTYLTTEVDGSTTNEIELPDQTGNSGKLLTTDGTSPSWTTVTTFSGSYNDLSDVPANIDTDATDDFDGAYGSLTGAPANVSSFTNDVGYLTTETDPAVSANFDFTDAANGDLLQFNGTKWVKLTPDYISDYTVTESDVTDHKAALTITESQISDLQAYLTTETDPAVTDNFDFAGASSEDLLQYNGAKWVKVTPTYISDYTVTESDVTAHEAALTITESQISDLDHFTTADETDPGVPTGTQTGEMQYWNGTAWVIVAPASSSGQTLYFINNKPQWGPLVGSTDVQNPTTGKIWMDRDLGASQVATSSTDYLAYGSLFQWGRLSDGHEDITWTSSISGTPVNGTTSTTSNSDDPGHSNFITPSNSTLDWRDPQNDDLWQGLSGTNNPCPSGYRLPTYTEWDNEHQSWSSDNAAGAFDSPLKLPVAGFRDSSTGTFHNVGSNGLYWSSTVNGSLSWGLFFNSSNAYMTTYYRARGLSVRCIKD